jgi:hypothetical protein
LKQEVALQRAGSLTADWDLIHRAVSGGKSGRGGGPRPIRLAVRPRQFHHGAEGPDPAAGEELKFIRATSGITPPPHHIYPEEP